MSQLVQLSGIRGIQWYIGLCGALLALTYTFLIYPVIGDSTMSAVRPRVHRCC